MLYCNKIFSIIKYTELILIYLNKNYYVWDLIAIFKEFLIICFKNNTLTNELFNKLSRYKHVEQKICEYINELR